MGAANQSEIVFGANTFSITRVPTGSNTPEVYSYSNIKGVVPVQINSRPAPGSPDYNNWKYRFDTLVVVDTLFNDDTHLSFDVQEITNQAGWTANLAGQIQCVADFTAVM